MKEIYEMDVYRLTEQLSDMIQDAFDKWSLKAQILFNRVMKYMGDSLPQIEKSFTSMHGDHSKRPKRGYAKSSGEK